MNKMMGRFSLYPLRSKKSLFKKHEKEDYRKLHESIKHIHVIPLLIVNDPIGYCM